MQMKRKMLENQSKCYILRIGLPLKKLNITVISGLATVLMRCRKQGLDQEIG